jgi:glycosyltransferase involved in cell wall biosynthesis
MSTTRTYPPLLVMIPAYNEEDSLAKVIGDVKSALPSAEIVVINDGSVDGTAQVGKAAGAVVVSLPHNLGIGAAMQTAFIYAMENGYQIAVQVDGDGQHDPAEIAQLLPQLINQECDVVIGSRYIEDRGYITPWQRRVGIIVLAHFISLLTGKKYTDPTSGFRASNRKTIEFCARNYPSDYPEPEALVLFRKAGIRVCEKPVTMNARYGGMSSITPLRSAYYMVKVMLAIVIIMLRRKPK